MAEVLGTVQPKYAGNKHKSVRTLKMHMFAILDVVKSNTKNIRDLNLAVVRHMTIEVT
jgi:hypothetical protein